MQNGSSSGVLNAARSYERLTTSVDEGLVRAQLDEIRTLLVTERASAALSIGRSLLQRFFGGSAARYRSRTRRNGNVSFAALLRHPELKTLGISRTNLYGCVSIWIQYHESGVERLRELSKSHQIALLPAPRDRLPDLVDTALTEALSHADLKSLVERERRLRDESRPRRGRPATPAPLKESRAAVKLLDRVASSDLGDLPGSHRDELLHQLQGLRDRAEDLLARLQGSGFVS